MTDENLAEVEQLCLSQDDKSGTHNSQRQAARVTGMSRRLVQRVLKRRSVHPFKRMQTTAMNVLRLTKPFNFSQIFYHFLFGNSFAIRIPVHPFLVKYIQDSFLPQILCDVYQTPVDGTP